MRLFNKYITVFAWAAAAVMLMSGTVYAVPSDSEKPVGIIRAGRHIE